ncbi:MAG: GSCFA domain-containing protein [Rikenellaceae bacterium]|nr:GSCFA domain-containing protein [Rikenellaceae bacterium]
MEFRTKINIPEYGFQLDYNQKGLIIGSCFAENIGKMMTSLKFPVTVNPFGVVYNPLSVVNTFKILDSKKEFTEKDINENNGIWFSFNHHGSFSSPEKDILLERINNSLTCGKKALEESDYLIITLGTSWVYKLAATGIVVNNCHKLPAKYFVRDRLPVDVIIDSFSKLFSNSKYASKKIIVTVSPVRHIKDGIPANSLSKSTLVVAANYLTEKFPNVHYFPSYEIVMDDLRDYRFYAADMLHPSEVAIDYIWENFRASLISEDAVVLSGKIEKLMRALSHRPLYPESVQYKRFTEKINSDIRELQSEYPFVDFNK